MNKQFDRGVLLENGNDPKGARSAYEQAIALDPHHVEALASLAWLAAEAGDNASAVAWAKRALNLDSSNVLASMAMTSAALQSDELDAASTGLAELYTNSAVTGVNRSIVLGLVGDLNDALGESTRAFKAYEAANAQLRALVPAVSEQSALAHVTRLISWFESADSDSWRRQLEAPPTAADPKAHVFLVGFPRSGTTLLENVLAAHPDAVALEEKDTLAHAARAYFMSDQGLERLARLDRDEAAEQRKAYWAKVRSFGIEPRGRVFIDKMPLASVLLPAMAKIFPNARVLFARRDPRDVVFSCFRRRFGLNVSMYELLTLEGAATYYDAVMRLAEVYRGVLPLKEHVVRYESVVEDFEGTVRAACDFVGLDWDQDLKNFAVKARTRGISTPSAAQIGRGLNRDGQGAWRRYKEQMAPVLPLLDPWVERFGYANE